MTNFAYTIGIPDGPHNPSSDQPPMKENNDNNALIWAVDHHGFNDNLGGYHNIIHQDPQLADPAPIAGIGQTYVKTVGSDVQLFYESGLGIINQLTNSSGILPRVAVNFTVTATVPTIQTSFNVTSVVRNALGSYTINFTNPVSSQFYYPCINAQIASGSFAGVSNVATANVYVPTTTAITLGFQNPNSSAGQDPIFASLIIFL